MLNDRHSENMPDHFICSYGKSGLSTPVSCAENFSTLSSSDTSQDSGTETMLYTVS